MKRVLILVTLLSIIQACTQKNKTMITQNPTITANNIVDELIKEVKHYSKEPAYFVSYDNEMCYFEIFVNDIPAFKNFNQPLSSSAFQINPNIFKNGIQKVTCKLYPVGKTEYSENEQKVFGKDTKLTLKISVADNIHQDLQGDMLNEFVTPITITKDEYGNNIENFIATGKDYYEASYTFDAKAAVPFNLEGFENAQDLRKLDLKTLESKLVKEYVFIRNIYQNREYDNIAKISYNSLRDQFIAEYQTKENIQSIWEELMGAFKNSSFEMQPIENYKMVFFAEGKLVALMQTTQDNHLRGNTVLWAKVNHDGGLRPLFLNSYFYIPKGKTEFEVY